VTEAEYKAWLDQAKTKFASDAAPTGQRFAAVAAQIP
jgi:hypothetical protein